ncbi:MAG TPA: sigma-70 family RNA polymerase sigma factor [Anaerolineae bacterium]|nr:sigma-70 family RNA polymerase sigma factor [Anaerolineae bacterium]
MNEEALIASARQGDLTAFNRLVLAYQQMAYNLAYRVVGNQDGAMDATQAAFLRGYRALHQFRGGSFKAWLLRIVTNCCYDQLRARQRRPTTPLDDILEDDDHSQLLQNHGQQPEDQVERRELGAFIQAGIQTLPNDQRVVLVMRDIQGMSYLEISETIMVSLGTIKSRLSRARAKMRDYLLSHREQLPDRFRLRGG